MVNDCRRSLEFGAVPTLVSEHIKNKICCVRDAKSMQLWKVTNMNQICAMCWIIFFKLKKIFLINFFSVVLSWRNNRHGPMNWFKIGKGVHQGCILSPCLFNFYAEYIMWNFRLDESQAESRLLGEVSITSDMQMTPPLWQKVKRN